MATGNEVKAFSDLSAIRTALESIASDIGDLREALVELPEEFDKTRIQISDSAHDVIEAVKHFGS